MSTLLLLAAFAPAGLLLNALMLWIAGRLFRLERATYRRALAAVLLLSLLSVAATVGIAALGTPAPGAAAALVGLGQLALAFLLAWLSVVLAMRAPAGRGALVAVAGQLLTIPVTAGLYFGITLFVDAFVMPTNSMAPTLRGPHFLAPCPHCGNEAVISAAWAAAGEPPPPDPEEDGVCTACRRISAFPRPSGPWAAGDRFLRHKGLTPGRWDLVVFRPPQQPETIYVKRLVGLPGEKVEIRERTLWINGARAVPPEELRGIEYRPSPLAPLTDEEERPKSWDLGPDEYFVLGDFTTQANDSRLMGTLREADFAGVATVLYWPPARWRVFR